MVWFVFNISTAYSNNRWHGRRICGLIFHGLRLNKRIAVYFPNIISLSIIKIYFSILYCLELYLNRIVYTTSYSYKDWYCRMVHTAMLSHSFSAVIVFDKPRMDHPHIWKLCTPEDGVYTPKHVAWYILLQQIWNCMMRYLYKLSYDESSETAHHVWYIS